METERRLDGDPAPSSPSANNDESFLFLPEELRSSTPVPPPRDLEFLEGFREKNTGKLDLQQSMQLWTSVYGGTHESVDKLLHLLRLTGRFPELPLTCKTLLKDDFVGEMKEKIVIKELFKREESRKRRHDGTPASVTYESIGEYLHFGLVEGIMLASAGESCSKFK
jgi:hypothetical protein